MDRRWTKSSVDSLNIKMFIIYLVLSFPRLHKDRGISYGGGGVGLGPHTLDMRMIGLCGALASYVIAYCFKFNTFRFVKLLSPNINNALLLGCKVTFLLSLLNASYLCCYCLLYYCAVRSSVDIIFLFKNVFYDIILD